MRYAEFLNFDEPDSVDPYVQQVHEEMEYYKNTLQNQVYVILNYLYGHVEFDKEKLCGELEDLCGLVDLDYNIFEDLAIEAKNGEIKWAMK